MQYLNNLRHSSHLSHLYVLVCWCVGVLGELNVVFENGVLGIEGVFKSPSPPFYVRGRCSPYPPRGSGSCLG
jgi:hypothetical protein